MKDSLDSAAVGRAPEPKPETPQKNAAARPSGTAAPAGESPRAAGDEFSNRKLIRPSLPHRERGGMPERGDGSRTASAMSKKPAPPDQTYAENFYYQKQMQSRTPMVVVLQDGEEIRGVIEWYDKDCIKLNRTGPHPNLLIYKLNIKYIYKESEGNGRR
jgi:sRNA-binding regulator protein Hfq